MAQELKTYDFPVDHGDFTATVEQFYIKSEADKVIAEKDAVIAGLKRENKRLEKEASCTFADDCLRLRQTKRKLRRQKYKRCLAMARWCFTKSNYHFVLARHGEDGKENNRKSILYSKWYKRWLELAEKFKEAK